MRRASFLRIQMPTSFLPVQELERHAGWEQAEHRIAAEQAPLILGKRFQDWKPVIAWNAGYLARRIGRNLISVSRSNECEFPALRPDAREDRLDIPVAALLERLSEPGPPYYYANGREFFFDRGESSPALAALQPDIALDPALAPTMLVRSALWLGGRTRSRPHFDGNGCHNLNIQVSGSKEFLLVAPRHAARLRMVDEPELGPLSHFSRIPADALFDPSFTLPDVDRYHCRLEPGDALVIPALWFHAVRSGDGLNINVNYWSIAGQAYWSRFLGGHPASAPRETP